MHQILLKIFFFFLPDIVLGAEIKLFIRSFNMYKTPCLMLCPVFKERNGEPDRQGSQSSRKEL